jgi:D-sedoheptulose 7-phosphate isomerase
MKPWMENYLKSQRRALDSLPVETLSLVIDAFHRAWKEERQIFVFGNGGSASSCSHFATDLGKGSSDRLARRFKIISLNENTAWITALGNDYSYEEIFVRQLMNYAQPGDIAFTMSVSGSSPNLVKAMEWAKTNGLVTIALVGEKRGKLATIADHVMVIDDGHYGRVEDSHMAIAHMICYAFMENAEHFSS